MLLWSLRAIISAECSAAALANTDSPVRLSAAYDDGFPYLGRIGQLKQYFAELDPLSKIKARFVTACAACAALRYTSVERSRSGEGDPRAPDSSGSHNVESKSLRSRQQASRHTHYSLRHASDCGLLLCVGRCVSRRLLSCRGGLPGAPAVNKTRLSPLFPASAPRVAEVCTTLTRLRAGRVRIQPVSRKHGILGEAILSQLLVRSPPHEEQQGDASNARGSKRSPPPRAICLS